VVEGSDSWREVAVNGDAIMSWRSGGERKLGYLFSGLND